MTLGWQAIFVSIAIGCCLSARAEYAPFSLQPEAPTQASALKKLDGVNIDQRLGSSIPLDLVFNDEDGHPVKLGQFFDGKRPVVLTLVYFDCPMLCTLVLNDLTRSLNMMPLSVGDDFQIVTVSFNPKETPRDATDKKETYLRAYRRNNAEQGWHFLTTPDEATIHKLTDAVGFHYKYDEKFKQYIHPSGITVLTPTGVISRYFFGIDYGLKDLRLSLQEASGNKIGSITDQILLFCFHYDEATGRYSLMVMRLVQAAGVLTLGALGTFWFVMYRREHRPAGNTPVEPPQ